MAAPITLPKRSPGRDPGRVGQKVPDAGNVPQIAQASDPGLKIPNFGIDLEGIIEPFRKEEERKQRLAEAAAKRQQKLVDATARSEQTIGFHGDMGKEMERRAAEDDPTRSGYVAEVESFADQNRDRRLAELRSNKNLSPETADETEIDINLSRQKFIDSARSGVVTAIRQRGEDAVKTERREFTASVVRNPDLLDATLDSAVASLKKFDNSFSANKERDELDLTRRELIGGAVQGFVNTERFDDARAILKDKKYDKDIAPQLRESLQRNIDVAEARAERKRDIELRSRTSEALTVLRAGKTPEGVADLANDVKGTKFEQPLREAIEDRGTLERFNESSIPEQTAALQAASSPKVMTARGVRRAQAMDTALRSNVRALKSDGVGFGAAKGLYEIEPLDVTNPAMIARRVRHASIAESHFGVPISPFRKTETAAIKRALETSTPAQALTILNTLSQGLGDERMKAYADDIGADDGPFSLAMGMAPDRPDLALSIIEGAKLRKETKGLSLPPTDTRTAFESVYGDAFQDSPGTVGAFIEAGSALYASRMIPAGKLDFDSSEFEKALQDVGGGVATFNGQKMLVPRPGMTEDQVEDAVHGLTSIDLANYGNGNPVFSNGKPFTPELFKSRFFGSEAQLRTVGLGRYRVFMKGMGYVVTGNGTPYEIDLGRYLSKDDAF